MSANPYAAPTARVADGGVQAAPALWNPNAAASWSLLLSPAFGSYLHLLNWRALGNADKEATGNGWFIASLVMLALYIGIALALPNFDMRYIGFGYLLAWYFAAAREQAKYVKDTFGNDYPRKGWGKALLIGVAAFIGYVVLAIMVGFVVGLASVAAQ